MGIAAIVLYLFYNALKPIKVLPVYQPAMVNYELVDSTLQHIKKFHQIAPFRLTNQNGENHYSTRLSGLRFMLLIFFFTTCPTICPKMTENMALIQAKILDDSQVKLLSFSVTPQIDSVAQLKRYAIEKEVNDQKMEFWLRGDKKEIYTLARKSFLAVKEDGKRGGPLI